MKHVKHNMKNIISGLFSFLLTLLFLLLFVCIGLFFGVFNNRSISSNINKVSYYHKVYVELNKKAEETVKQAVLPESVLYNVITLDRVYIGGNNYINGTLMGKEPKISTNKLRSDLSDQIDLYLNMHGIKQTDEVKKVKDKVVNRIEQEYLYGVKLPVVGKLMELKSKFIHLMLWVMPLLILLIGTIGTLLLRIHKYKHRSMRYINYAMISSSILIIVGSLYLMAVKGYERINVIPDYYRELLAAFIKSDILALLCAGGVAMIISISLISFTGYLKNSADY